MESTFIKIKFMALVRRLENDTTKCLLEIVPDVSCIENIDKIKWNNDNKLVEYNVPVNYKIILKKDPENNQEKIYYSCVDFRHLTTDSDLACGDVAKVFSDNCVLRSTDFTKNVTQTCQLDIRNKHDIIIRGPFSSNETRERCVKKNEIYVENMEELQQVRFAPKAVETDKDCIEFNSENKPIKLFRTGKTISKETINDVIEARSDQHRKRKLTVTSICTLNMIDFPATRTFNEECIDNSKLYVKNEKKCNIDINKEKGLLPLYNPFHTCNENLTSVHDITPFQRILPATRVAQFMMTVENEILPLRIMLSEIYRKCNLLGLFWKTRLFQTSSNIQPHTNKNKLFTQRKPKCNRVVYSIVFEE